jgi:glycerol-3-phosphate acyltransferase PlsX
MRIVLDAMGSDACPTPDVAGAVLAAKELKDTIILVGARDQIERELKQHDTKSLHLDIVHADDAIQMTDKPSLVGKSRSNSSMHVGLGLVQTGQADAFVTAGNTGAAMAVATLHTLHRIRGVRRPALASIIPIVGGRVILLDIGANTDSKPEWLFQFALMGKLYAQLTLGLASPSVALLSNGEEDEKGNQLVQEAQALIQTSDLNFIGQIEPKDMLRGKADVIVADGFVGNIAVKTLEGFGSVLKDLIRTEIRHDLISTVGGLLVRHAFRRIYHQIDPFEIGGAPLLGVNGVVIIGHGRSNARAIKNAIRQAHLAVAGNVVEAIRTGLADSPTDM